MLSMTYELAEPHELPRGDDDTPVLIDIQEDRGHVLFRVSTALNPAQIMRALNFGAEEVIKGGHWFQEWKGEILAWAGSVQRRPSLYLAAHDESGAA